MILNPPKLKQGYIFLFQMKNRNIKSQLSNAIAGEDIGIVEMESAVEFGEQYVNGQIITFLIGSDVEDPVQSAQRMHALENNAKIILLSTSGEKSKILKEAIRFSPFLGSDVFCIDESDESELERLGKILRNSVQAEKNRAIIASSNSQISSSFSSQKQAYNQQFINKVLDVAPIGIAAVNTQGKVLGWNKEAASIFNKTEVQVLGVSLFQLFDPIEGVKLEEFIRDSFNRTTSSGPIDLELERESQDSTKRILNFTAAPFTYSGSHDKSLILAIKDVTEQERAKHELRMMNETLEERVKKRTAALLSYQDQLRSLGSQLSKAEENERQRLATELHDNLGQMLALLKIKLSLIQKKSLSDDIANDILDMKTGLDDALVYTRNLMSDLKPPPTLDNEDIGHTIKWLAQKMEKHALRITIKDDKKPKPVADEIRIIIIQCMRELLFNILKHAGVNEARITVFRLNKEAQIIVEDDGAGFNPTVDRTRLLESGFGLFNVSERIDLLGGSLDIESETGKGTKVTLCVPLIEKGGNILRSAEEDMDVRPMKVDHQDKIKVLLVDDHKMMRDGLKKIINEQPDLTVIAEAADGEGALKIAEMTCPDVVVMDVNIPVIDGIETTRKLLEKMPDVRVIGLSFHAHQDVVDSMKNAGATAYLTKTEAFETLCATIRSETRQKS